MVTTIQKWGNSQGIRIPKVLLDEIHWNEDEKIKISAENGRIIIEKDEPRKNIFELFADYDGDFSPASYDWGEPAGEEIW